MKKKLISILHWCLNKLEHPKKTPNKIVNLNSSFQTKKNGIDVEQAKLLVIGQCLNQAKKHISIGVVSGIDGFEKVVGSLRISKNNILNERQS